MDVIRTPPAKTLVSPFYYPIFPTIYTEPSLDTGTRRAGIVTALARIPSHSAP
jgi:hypothetical protein